MQYYRLEPGLHAISGLSADPQLPEGTNFLAGRQISESLPSPLVFEVDYPPGEKPAHYLVLTIPVASSQFLNVLRNAGVDNFQTFPAVLRNPGTGEEWPDYSALNIVGVLDTADLDNCKYDVIMPGGEGIPPLLDFEHLVFTGSRTKGLLMFRLLQNRPLVFIHENVREQLRQNKPVEGWGITTFEISVT